MDVTTLLVDGAWIRECGDDTKDPGEVTGRLNKKKKYFYLA